jgi:serine/threonine-protein kinase
MNFLFGQWIEEKKPVSDETLGDRSTEIPDEDRRQDLQSGDHLREYRVIRLLGRGGMGQVYEVEHEVLDRRFALKILPEELSRRPGFLRRFRDEARVMANLQHPHIVSVGDSGTEDGRYFLRMELVEGLDLGPFGLAGRARTLGELAGAGDGKIEQSLVAEILAQVLEALAYAHGRGVVHRDVKPGNILLAEGAGESRVRVKVSDFGLVRLVGAEWLRSQAERSVSRSMSLGGERTIEAQASEGGGKLHACDAGHLRLHEPRAETGRGSRRAQRPVCGGTYGLPAADRV